MLCRVMVSFLVVFDNLLICLVSLFSSSMPYALQDKGTKSLKARSIIAFLRIENKEHLN